ncbi:hypothetical protein OHQ88_33520 (plasmid) [Micromonospora zamorensis]
MDELWRSANAAEWAPLHTASAIERLFHLQRGLRIGLTPAATCAT